MERKRDTENKGKPLSAQSRLDVEHLASLSGKEILERIEAAPDPRALVQEMAQGDFFWVVKKVGMDDCLPVLEQASEDQWQYLLDMELWKKDRFDLAQGSGWLFRLHMANPRGLASWLLSEGQGITYYYFHRSLEVSIKEDDDPEDFPDGFFTVDGTYYVRARDPEQRPQLEEMLRSLAAQNLMAYQSLLLGLAGVLPAESEEQLYRMKSVRLAEHGFLPREEAISVYSPLEPSILASEELPPEPGISHTEEIPGQLVPVSPFIHLGRNQLLGNVVRSFADPLLQDRIYLEFAGLCNQIFSADGDVVNEAEELVKICRKAAGYVSLSLENSCAGDLQKAREILKKHSLVSLFRVGFGLVLHFKWDVAKWLKEAWFWKRGFDLTFWGDEWGETIGALLFERPLYYCGKGENGPYRDFFGLPDLERCREIVHHVMALDFLLSRIEKGILFSDWKAEKKGITFHPLLFNLWARTMLGVRPSFAGISRAQAKHFFFRLREGDEGPPYRMHKFENAFLEEMIRLASVPDEGGENVVAETLALLWQRFREEYEQLALEDLDRRFSRYLTITAPGETSLR
jgi:hypothetical protein